MDLLDLQDQLNDTAAAIARLEERLAKRPHDEIISLNLRSLRKRQQNFEEDFAQAAAGRGLDVCAYRLFRDYARPTVAGFANALSDFQKLFSLVYDALKNGPKEEARVKPEAALETTFGFGYTYSGSLGVVMTIPNEKLLFGGTRLDETLKTIFDLAQAKEPEDILLFARQIGIAPIRAVYKWANDHAAAGLGADIEWRRAKEVHSRLMLQSPELDRLSQTINATSQERHETIEVIGVLVGAHVTRRSFYLELEDGSYLRGAIADSVSTRESTLQLPKRYRAVLKKTTKINFSTDKEDIKYLLTELTDI